jgi:methylaspartate ammonia-lyase
VYFHHVRDITVSGFSAEADPRSSAPAANKLFVMGKIDNPQGHAMYLRFVDSGGADVLGATADFTAWFKDADSGAWVSIDPESAAPSARVFMSSMTGTMFVQITAMAGVGSAVTCQVWACELSALPVT